MNNSATQPSLNQILEVATEAARSAGKLIRERRAEQSVTVSFKGDRNLVTTTDVESEKLIISIISKNFPDHRILAEETDETVEPSAYLAGPTWVIDPIDGTTNFAHEHHHVGVSIAYTVGGRTEVGVVASPFTDEIFTAVVGGGAYLNGKKIQCTNTSKVSDALIATGFPYVRDTVGEICARLTKVAKECRDIRRLGAASLDISWVACGRLDAYYEETLMPWDGAAGVLIAREAGAVIGHYPYTSDSQRKTEKYPGDLCVDNLIVTNAALYDELLALLS